MESLVDSGHIRTIGVSNYDAEHIAEILSFARIPPAVNQVHEKNAIRILCPQSTDWRLAIDSVPRLQRTF